MLASSSHVPFTAATVVQVPVYPSTWTTVDIDGVFYRVRPRQFVPASTADVLQASLCAQNIAATVLAPTFTHRSTGNVSCSRLSKPRRVAKNSVNNDQRQRASLSPSFESPQLVASKLPPLGFSTEECVHETREPSLLTSARMLVAPHNSGSYWHGSSSGPIYNAPPTSRSRPCSKSMKDRHRSFNEEEVEEERTIPGSSSAPRLFPRNRLPRPHCRTPTNPPTTSGTAMTMILQVSVLPHSLHPSQSLQHEHLMPLESVHTCPF